MTNLNNKSLVPPTLVTAMLALGWSYNEERGQWWKTYPDGAVWSDNHEDHAREFPNDLAAAALEVNGAEGNANESGATTDAGVKAETTGAAADAMSSSQVANNDRNTAFERAKPEDSFDHQVRDTSSSQQQDQQQQ